ncbi:hypothetical protein CHK22_08875 [Salmonella enterica]|uniref:Uncharacterized protein n=1 Tax=Salmonella virchow TaxID=48409 RepID=A0A5I7P6S4_SALVI|nr:hypothetical protein [Salmonella enterica]EBK1726180.1 hypothetical protein [Salmonella enterica subsp. enterica serovar Virchow]EDL3187478.1 hypothetical protein [Salmonella enterica subsp. enterica serovar Infantis]EED5427228.1 hypothetical protein [Salmonella enterica subsp. enterica]EAM2180318.1 hypothetical protein [Salmonella enterica]EAM9795112.1 hypothetical protein [Salmonella enterica]
MSRTLRSKTEVTSIWADKKTPPMEYMSLSRAARLLGCEPDDFWHWKEIGVINISVRAIGGAFFGWAKPKRPSEKDKVINDLNNAEKAEIFKIAQTLGIDMSWAHPTPRKRSKPDGSIEIQGMTYGGVWSISTPPGFSGIKKGVKKEYRLYAHKKGKKADYTIFLVGDEQHEITNESAYILRDDIERLYASIETGEFPLAPSFFEDEINLQNEDKAQPAAMPSTLGGFIKGLIHLVPDLGPEVINMNSNKRKEVIRRVFEDAAKKNGFDYKAPSAQTIDKYLEI